MEDLSVKLLSARYATGRGGELFFDGRGYALLYATSGEAILRVDGEEISVHPGELYVSEKGNHFSTKSESGAIFLTLSATLPDNHSVFGKKHKVSERVRRHLGEIMRELSSHRSDPFFYRVIENSLSTVLLLLLRGEETEISEELLALCEPVKTEAQAIRHYLLENYSSEITLEGLCFLFRTNKTALCREFKREYGKTVREYLSELRISEAKRLLREGRLSVTDISERLGFESIHYFSRAFKSAVGITPTEYKGAERKKKELMGEV